MAVHRLPYERDLALFDRIVAEAQATIVGQINTAIASGDLTTARLKDAQLASIARTLEHLQSTIVPLGTRMVQDAWHQAAARAGQQVQRLSLPAPEIPGAFAGVSREAVEVMQRSISDRLDSAVRTVGRQVADVYAREQRNAAFRAILGADGSTGLASRHLAETLAKRDLRRAKTDGGTGFVDASGRRWSLDAYSRMAVRTVTREAVVQGAMARMVSHGIAVARVSTHAGSCPICLPFQGTLVALAPGVIEWQGEAVSDPGEVPPYHPNCAHSLMPVAATTQSIREQIELLEGEAVGA